MAFHLGPTARTVLRWGGVVIATLVVFVLALQLTFPYERVKLKIVEALSDKYDVTVGDIERSWVPGRFALKALSLRTRAVKADDPVNTFYIERLEVDLHFLAALHGVASVDIDAKIGAGHITGNVALGKANTSIHLEGNDLPSASLPMREAIGLPTSGKVNFSIAFDLPNEVNKAGKRAPDWSLADGEIAFSCPTGCAVGDGKTKLKPKLKNARSQAFAAEGIEFGPVELQSLFAEIQITPGPGDGKPGKLVLKRFDTKSLDGELKVDFMMATMPDLNDSPVTGCLRFRASEVLDKRVPKTFAELQTTGAQLGPDNLFHIKLTDKFREIKRLPQTCGPDANTSMDNPGAGSNPAITRPGRPNLTVTPDSPTPPPPPPPAITPVTPPAPPPVQGAAATGSGSATQPPNHPAGPEGEGSAGSAGSAAPGSDAPAGQFAPAQPAPSGP